MGSFIARGSFRSHTSVSVLDVCGRQQLNLFIKMIEFIVTALHIYSCGVYQISSTRQLCQVDSAKNMLFILRQTKLMSGVGLQQ